MINLDAALSIASGGLANVNRHMAIVSQNVRMLARPDMPRRSARSGA